MGIKIASLSKEMALPGHVRYICLLRFHYLLHSPGYYGSISMASLSDWPAFKNDTRSSDYFTRIKNTRSPSVAQIFPFRSGVSNSICSHRWFYGIL